MAGIKEFGWKVCTQRPTLQFLPHKTDRLVDKQERLHRSIFYIWIKKWGMVYGNKQTPGTFKTSHTHACTCAHTHTHTYTRMHACARTHTHKHSCWLRILWSTLNNDKQAIATLVFQVCVRLNCCKCGKCVIKVSKFMIGKIKFTRNILCHAIFSQKFVETKKILSCRPHHP